MKPKILLAKYLDWAVLAILAIVLIIVAIKSFPLRAGGEQKLRDEISQYDQSVQRSMSDTSAQPLPVHDYLREIQNRFEHPAILDPYRHNPFLMREDISSPALPLVVGVPHTLNFLGTRFTGVIAGDEKLVRVNLAYDLLTSVSTVTFTPLKTGSTDIRIQADDDLVHRFEITVRALVTPPPPNPPSEIAVVPSGAQQYKNIIKQAMVLISFTPDNPAQLSQTVGISTEAAVYRKPADASDAEYERLDDPDQPLRPLTDRAQIHALWLKFHPEEIPAAGPAPATPAEAPAPTAPTEATTPTGAAPPTPPVAQEAAAETQPPALTGAEQTGEPPAGSFVFLDQTVDDGESYIYKILTFSTALDEPDIEPVPCVVPYVSPRIYLPSIVEFTVRAITPVGATVRVSRLDPETGLALPPEEFLVGVGKKIGGMKTLKFLAPPDQQVPGLPLKHIDRDIDFSTGCILVDVLPTFQVIEYNKLRWLHLGGDIYMPVYQAKEARDPQILYLTARGEEFHLKAREK